MAKDLDPEQIQKKQQPRAEKAIEREEAINPINPERRIKMTNVPFFPSPKTFLCGKKYFGQFSVSFLVEILE